MATATIALSACGAPPVPETYGVYAREGSTLRQLPENGRTQLDGHSEFVVFDKIIGSGLFGGAGVELEEVFAIHQSALIRYDVERVKDPRSGAITEVHISPSGEWLTLEEGVEVAFGPIEGQTEMLLIRPLTKLADGLYTLRIHSTTYPFAVGLNPDAAAESPLNRCKDRHSDARPKSSTFSWGDWLNNVQGTGQSVHGNWLESTGYFDCSVLDNEAGGWKHAASEAVRTGAVEEGVGPAKLFTAYDPNDGQELMDTLFERLDGKAQQAFEAEAWAEAVHLAGLGLALRPADQGMVQISSTARQKQQEIEQAEKAAAEALHASRVAESHTATQTLGQFSVISNKVSRKHGLVPNATHPIEITDVSIRGLAYLSDSGWITSTNNLQNEFWFCWISEGDIGPGTSHQGKPLVRLEFRNGWGWAAVFNTEAERARFTEVFNSAIRSWYRRYGDLIVNGRCPGA